MANRVQRKQRHEVIRYVVLLVYTHLFMKKLMIDNSTKQLPYSKDI